MTNDGIHGMQYPDLRISGGVDKRVLAMDKRAIYDEFATSNGWSKW